MRMKFISIISSQLVLCWTTSAFLQNNPCNTRTCTLVPTTEISSSFRVHVQRSRINAVPMQNDQDEVPIPVDEASSMMIKLSNGSLERTSIDYPSSSTQFRLMPIRATATLSPSFTMTCAMTIAYFFLLYPTQSVHAKDDIARGNEIFTGNCAGCHAGGMNFVKEKKTLKKDALTKFVSPTLDTDEVNAWLQKSGQHQRTVFLKAPSGNGKLTDDDWSDVTSYVVDQAGGEKW